MGNASKKPSIIDMHGKEHGVGKFKIKSNVKLFSGICTVGADGGGVLGEGAVQNDGGRREAQNFGILGTKQRAKGGMFKYLTSGGGSGCTGGKTGSGGQSYSTK